MFSISSFGSALRLLYILYLGLGTQREENIVVWCKIPALLSTLTDEEELFFVAMKWPQLSLKTSAFDAIKTEKYPVLTPAVVSCLAALLWRHHRHPLRLLLQQMADNH